MKNRLLAQCIAVRTYSAQTRRLNASVAARQTKLACAGFYYFMFSLSPDPFVLPINEETNRARATSKSPRTSARGLVLIIFTLGCSQGQLLAEEVAEAGMVETVADFSINLLEY